MKNEHEEQEISPSEARKIAEKMRDQWGDNDMAAVTAAIRADEETAQFYKTDGKLHFAVREVAFDMAMEDPNIGHLTVSAQLKRLEQKLTDYALDEQYRNKYAGMARS